MDEERGVVRTEAVFRMPGLELGTEMPPGMGLSGRVFATQKPVCLERYGDLEDPVLPALMDDPVIGVPIFWRERMIGFFGLGSTQPRRFGERDVEILSLFARHAAIAIENARRYEWEQRRTERLALIARVGRIITSNLQLDDLLQRAADAIRELLGYRYIAIALPDPTDPDLLWLAAVAGGGESASTRHFRVRRGEGILGTVAVEQQPFLVRDVSSHPRYIPTPGTDNIQSELALPILHGDQLLGVLNAESDRLLTEDDEASLGIIADQLAVAIDNARLYTDSQRSLEEMHLLYRASQHISTAMDVDEVVKAYLERVAVRSPHVCSVALYEWDAEGRRNAVVVHGRWSPGGEVLINRERFPYSQDDLDPLLDVGQTIAIPNVHKDPRASRELCEAQSQSGYPAVAMIPLIARGVRLGLVVLCHATEFEWREGDLRNFQTTAAQLAAAIDSRQQRSQLFERNQEVAVLEERARLARELHDSVTQLLFSITLIAQSLSGAWRRDPSEGERRVGRLLELSRSALAEMRALLTGWRPTPGTPSPSGIMQVGRAGVVEALTRHITTALPENLNVDLDASRYTPQALEYEEALYRISQEALSNIVKHAGATRVKMALAVDDIGVSLTISDDGRGFTEHNVEKRRHAGPASGGMGLTSMRERTRALGGTVRVNATPGRGTTVSVLLPRKERLP